MKSYSPKLQVSFDTYQVADAGPHHARRRAAQRHGGPAGPQPAPDLHQRPLRHRRASPAARAPRTPAAPSDPTRDAPPADPNAPLDNLAPGVNDDGSGTALTIELARVFSQSGIDFDATLVFMCHVGEEQGLVGARCTRRRRSREKIPIEAVLNNDIVGNDRGGNGIDRRRDDPRLLGRARGFAVARAGAVRPALGRRATCRRTRCGRWRGPIGSGRGGDHSAYNQLGFTAVGFRESRENFTRQHDVRDTFEGISLPYLAQNARVNAAAAATLALAPPPPAC